MKLQDLPPALQAQALKAAGIEPKAKNRAEDRGPGLPLTCTTCGFVVSPVTDGRIARHAAETGHSRLEWRP